MSDYELRINGAATRYYSVVCQNVINEFLEAVKDHPKSKVELVKVSVITSLGGYEGAQMEGHFKAKSK